MQNQGDLQSLGKRLGAENGAPPGDRNDAFRQHLRGMYAGGGERKDVWIGTMWDFAFRCWRSRVPAPRDRPPGYRSVN